MFPACQAVQRPSAQRGRTAASSCGTAALGCVLFLLLLLLLLSLPAHAEEEEEHSRGRLCHMKQKQEQKQKKRPGPSDDLREARLALPAYAVNVSLDDSTDPPTADSVMVKVVPFPGDDSTEILPPCS